MRKTALALLVGSVAAGCPAPSDVTPLIHVSPGAAGRYARILGASSVAPPSVKPARVRVMTDADRLGGPNAIGSAGDLVLENDEVVFVIDRLASSAGFAESGGNLVDAADANDRRDELGQVFTFFGTFPRQGVYEAIATGTSSDGGAWVEATGHELYEPRLAVKTRYTLGAPDRALLLRTTLSNEGAAPVDLPALGDAIQWGGAEKVAPGKPRGFKGPSSGPYVGGVGRFTSYAMTSTDGSVDAVSGTGWTDTAERRDVRIAPGERVEYARVLVVGQRADTSSLVAELAQAAGQRVGQVEVHLRAVDGNAPVDVPRDARLSVRDGAGAEIMTVHAAGTPPRLSASLIPGRWTLVYAGGGGRAGVAPTNVEVRQDEVVGADLGVSRSAGVRVACGEAGAPNVAMPCKVTFETTDGAPAPDFGSLHAAGPAGNQVTTADGIADVELSPGAYRITASRGPEYTLAQIDRRLAAGDHVELSLSPRRVVDTAGYLACDFHQHTMRSADAPVATRDRVIANVAEGVEIAVASEHNVVSDLEPIVRDLGLEPQLVSIGGDELTSDASRHPWGHANVFPMTPSASLSRGGAPPVRDREAHEVFDALRRAIPGDFVIQVNHPRSGNNGYFDLLRFDPTQGAGTGAGYDATFDALEVWNGRNVDARGKVLADYFALLRTGHLVTPTADTDTHGIVGQEAGYPRTYVRVADDAHLEAWDTSRTADLVRGIKVARDVVLTNGPMLRVSANGAPIGGVARGRVVDVRVHVESAPWVAVDDVRVLRASSPDLAEAKAVSLKPLPSGAMGVDVAFTLRVREADAFVVVATGKRPLAPVLQASPDDGGGQGGGQGGAGATLPWAMTGAIRLDPRGP